MGVPTRSAHRLSPSRPSSRSCRDAAATTGPAAPPPEAKEPAPRPVVLRDEIPADQLDAVLKAHLQGLGHMERYEYAQAAQAFRDVHARARAGSPARSTSPSPS